MRLSGLTAAAVVLTSGMLQGGEVLYNGIELPREWPPRRTGDELRAGEPMHVPWLEPDGRPEVIPIDVGRQLFVDDFLIEGTTLIREFHKATFYEGNPVLRPDKRWERGRGSVPASAMAFSDGVFWDPAEKLFKMWYRFGIRGGTAYAISQDGKAWTKPALDGVQPGTNIVLLAGYRDSGTVWLDLVTSEPSQRYKLFQFHRDAWRSSVHVSADGLNWSAPIWTGPSWDRSTVFYNPFRNQWVYSIRAHIYGGPWDYHAVPPKPIGRARKYWEADDFVAGAAWTGRAVHEDRKDGEPVWWTACDRLDSPDAGPNDIVSELYNLDAVAYESIMLGLFSVWHGGSSAGRPKINDIMLGFSRDGFHWHRPFREAVIPVAETSDAWNWANVQSVGGGCLVVGDQLYFYASGRNAEEDTTGLAFLRRDGFASMNAGPQGGSLVTRPLTFSGERLFVNVACGKGGELRAELLDHSGKAIARYEQGQCAVVQTDSTLAAVRWAEHETLPEAPKQGFKIRFELRNAKLYSFWVSASASGASHGYVAAGGPGFDGIVDTVGKQ